MHWQILDSDHAAFVYFYAPWCQHCGRFTPVFEAFANQAEVDGVKMYKFDSTENDTPEFLKVIRLTGQCFLSVLQRCGCLSVGDRWRVTRQFTCSSLMTSTSQSCTMVSQTSTACACFGKKNCLIIKLHQTCALTMNCEVVVIYWCAHYCCFSFIRLNNNVQMDQLWQQSYSNLFNQHNKYDQVQPL